MCMRLFDLSHRALIIASLVSLPALAKGRALGGEVPDLTSGGRTTTTGGLGSTTGGPTVITTGTPTSPITGSTAPDPALQAQFAQLKEMCSQMSQGGSPGGSSSSGSGSLSSGSGGEDGGGGGGEDAWMKRENCKKADGGGKCWHVTATANGGGLVGGGGYNGRREVLEKYLKEEAEKALKILKEACEITTGAQLAGTSDNSPENQKLMAKAIGMADGAANIFGRIGEIEMPLVMPIMRSFPKPLAPMATQNDVKACGKDSGCKQQCTQSGTQLGKVSGDCVTKLDEITAWYIKKKKEALGLKEAWQTALNHMLGKGGSVTPQPMPAPQPSVNIVDAIPPASAEDPNDNTNARNLFIPEADGAKGVAKKDSGSESGFSGSGAPSSNATDLAAGNYTPVDSSNNSLGDNEADVTPAGAAAATLGAAGGNYAEAGAEDGESGAGGGGQYNGPKGFLGHLVGYGIETDQRQDEVAAAAGKKVAADRFHIMNGLSMARERVISANGKQDLKMEELTIFERGSRGLYGSDGHRAVGFANHENRLKSAKSEGIRPAVATQGRK